MTRWTTIVEAPLAKAAEAYDAWLRARGLTEEDIEAEELRVDTIRDVTGDVRRYRLSQSVAKALGVEE